MENVLENAIFKINIYGILCQEIETFFFAFWALNINDYRNCKIKYPWFLLHQIDKIIIKSKLWCSPKKTGIFMFLPYRPPLLDTVKILLQYTTGKYWKCLMSIMLIWNLCYRSLKLLGENISNFLLCNLLIQVAYILFAQITLTLAFSVFFFFLIRNCRVSP